MIKAAKILIIIEMVLKFWCVLPLIFGFIALKHLKEAKCRADVSVAKSILTLIFCSAIGGILMLCLTDEHFDSPAEPQNTEGGEA